MVAGYKCFPQEKEGLLCMQACEKVLKGSKGKEEKGEVTTVEHFCLLKTSGLFDKAIRVQGLVLAFLL